MGQYLWPANWNQSMFLLGIVETTVFCPNLEAQKLLFEVSTSFGGTYTGYCTVATEPALNPPTQGHGPQI
jgi:hypothetical protein